MGPSPALQVAPGRSSSAKIPTDAALVLEAQRGHVWAMDELVRRYLRLVIAVVARDADREDDRDDVVQECFVEAVRSIRSLRSPWAFGPWLSAIAARTTWRMSRRRRKRQHVGVVNRQLLERQLANMRAPTAPPDVSAELNTFRDVLEGLHDESRVALLLRRVEELQLDEIAERMNLSVSTVKRRLSAAETALDADRWTGMASKGPSFRTMRP